MTARRFIALAGVILAGGLLASCSSSADEGSLVGHLESLPALDLDEYTVLYYTDYDRLAEQTVLDRPAADDEDAVAEWYLDVMGVGDSAPWEAAGHHPQAFRQRYAETFALEPVDGIAITQVDSFVETMRGTFSWWGDFDDSAGTGDFTVVDGYLVNSPDDDTSAADDELLHAVAEALDDAEVYAAQIVVWGSDLEASDITMTGFGLSVQDEVPILTIVYGHAEDDEADETFDRAEEFFEEQVEGDLFSVRDLEVDGPRVIASLEIEGEWPLTQVWSLPQRFDPILLGGI